ncbi:MAG TPA: 30S ribosome-binding factor RbfA [Gemmatimonadaceae bacterium]|nr:30S ribosome-binding factor RbfA [Gemmatimonadaceae bacterium]
MPRDTRRPDRVGEAVREEIAAFLAGGVKDPRVVGLVTVTAVEMSRDLAQANVFVSIYGSDEDRALTMTGLESVASGLRGRVGRALRLRIAPHITFRQDESVARASRIESLLAGLKPRPGADASRPAGDPPEGSDDAR